MPVAYLSETPLPPARQRTRASVRGPIIRGLFVSCRAACVLRVSAWASTSAVSDVGCKAEPGDPELVRSCDDLCDQLEYSDQWSWLIH